MKTRVSLICVLLLSLAMASTATAQSPSVAHNTWTSVAPIPTPVMGAAAAVLGSDVYVFGGLTSGNVVVADTQVYNPATNTWSTGVPLPDALFTPASATVDNVLYVIGGITSDGTQTNEMWAYSPKSKTWTRKPAMPTARGGAGIVVENSIVYVIGGQIGDNFTSVVESYNPATNSWTEEAPTAKHKGYPVVGLIGSTVVAADGATADGVISHDNEGYDATTNSWSPLSSDPTARTAACGAAIGTHLYDAGGYANNGFGAPALTVSNSFSLTRDRWATLTSMPQGTMFGASAVYKGQLYCLGGWANYGGAPVSSVQVYQP